MILLFFLFILIFEYFVIPFQIQNSKSNLETPKIKSRKSKYFLVKTVAVKILQYNEIVLMRKKDQCWEWEKSNKECRRVNKKI